jgi:hypothetical protein
MKKYWAFAVAVLAMAGGAAQAVEVRPVLGMGLTGGGETLARVTYTNGETAKISSGGLIAFHGGLEVRFTDLVSAQGLVGYHFDRVNASNGDVVFERVPLELLGHFKLTDWVRVGGGLRYVTNAKLRATGEASNYMSNVTFKDKLGTVVEAEFFTTSSFGIKVRYVSERYTPKNVPGASSVEGNHGGVFLNYYFF